MLQYSDLPRGDLPQAEDLHAHRVRLGWEPAVLEHNGLWPRATPSQLTQPLETPRRSAAWLALRSNTPVRRKPSSCQVMTACGMDLVVS